MRILVLGGNGFIGSNLVNRLVAEGYSVKIFDRNPLREGSFSKNVEYQYGVFGDKTSIADALSNIDIVFHLISSSIPSTSNISPANDVKDNLVNTIGLLECMKEMNVSRIMYFSSGGTIYGNSDKETINEAHPLNPISSYGIVKLAIEKYLMMYQELYGFDPVIFRVSNPYGPWQGKLGAQGLINTLLFKAISNEQVEIWGNGGIIRDYIYIDDVADACVKAIESRSIGTFNIGSGIGESVSEILKIVEEVTQIKLDINYLNSRSFDVKKVILDITKAKSILNWEPKVPIEEGIRKYYNWLK